MIVRAAVGRVRTARRAEPVPAAVGASYALAAYQPDHDPFGDEPTVEELMAAATPHLATVEPPGPATGPTVASPTREGDGA